MKVSSELTQDRTAWSASVRDVVNSLGDAGSTRPGVNAEVSFGQGLLVISGSPYAETQQHASTWAKFWEGTQ